MSLLKPCPLPRNCSFMHREGAQLVRPASSDNGYADLNGRCTQRTDSTMRDDVHGHIAGRVSWHLADNVMGGERERATASMDFMP